MILAFENCSVISREYLSKPNDVMTFKLLGYASSYSEFEKLRVTKKSVCLSNELIPKNNEIRLKILITTSQLWHRILGYSVPQNIQNISLKSYRQTCLYFEKCYLNASIFLIKRQYSWCLRSIFLNTVALRPSQTNIEYRTKLVIFWIISDNLTDSNRSQSKRRNISIYQNSEIKKTKNNQEDTNKICISGNELI